MPLECGSIRAIIRARASPPHRAHLAAAWPGPLLEGPFAAGICGGIAEDVVREPLKVDGPPVTVPDGPGLGITLDEERIAKLRADL